MIFSGVSFQKISIYLPQRWPMEFPRGKGWLDFKKPKFPKGKGCLFELIFPEQSAKKVSFTACHSGKLKLAFTSPNIISTGPKHVLMVRIDFTIPSSKNFTSPSGKLRTKFTSPIAKSDSPATSFASCRGSYKTNNTQTILTYYIMLWWWTKINK